MLDHFEERATEQLQRNIKQKMDLMKMDLTKKFWISKGLLEVDLISMASVGEKDSIANRNSNKQLGKIHGLSTMLIRNKKILEWCIELEPNT